MVKSKLNLFLFLFLNAFIISNFTSCTQIDTLKMEKINFIELKTTLTNQEAFSFFLKKKLYSTYNKNLVYIDKNQNKIYYKNKKSTLIYSNKTQQPIQYITLFENKILGLTTDTTNQKCTFFTIQTKTKGDLLVLSNKIDFQELAIIDVNQYSFEKIKSKKYKDGTICLLLNNFYILKIRKNQEIHIFKLPKLILKKNSKDIEKSIYFTKKQNHLYLIKYLYKSNQYQGIEITTYNYMKDEVINIKKMMFKKEYFFDFYKNQYAVFNYYDKEKSTIHFNYYKDPAFKKKMSKTFEIKNRYPYNLSYENGKLEGFMISSNQIHFYQWK